MPGKRRPCLARILVVDDRQMVRHVIAQILQQWGHTVDLAKNGQDALARFAADPADLVVLDMFMPLMNGFDALVVFRYRYPDTKVLAMSGGGECVMEDALAEAKKLGAHAVLAKPFGAEEMLETVSGLLAD